jgi:hypothetical protein
VGEHHIYVTSRRAVAPQLRGPTVTFEDAELGHAVVLVSAVTEPFPKVRRLVEVRVRELRIRGLLSVPLDFEVQLWCADFLPEIRRRKSRLVTQEED